jgi:hypothetical protein
MRQVVEARDVQVYFGKSIHFSYKILKKVRQELKKERHHPITIREFAEFYRCDVESLSLTIQSNDLVKNETKLHPSTAEITKKAETKNNEQPFIHEPYSITKKNW